MGHNFENVKRTILNYLDSNVEIQEDTVVADLGLDSLDIVDIQMRLEEEYGYVIDPAYGVLTVKDLLCSLGD
jgi:acyl carrier protein